MPEAIIIATAAGAAGGLATGIALGLKGAALATFALINAGIAASVATLQYLLRDRSTEQKGNIKQTIRAAVTPVRYIIGRCRLSGVLAYLNTRREDDDTLDMAIILSEGRCGKIEGIWANGTKIEFVETAEEGGKYYKYVGAKSNRITQTVRINGSYEYYRATGPDGNIAVHESYRLTSARADDIDQDFGSGKLAGIQLFQDGQIQIVGPRFNKDVAVDITVFAGSRQISFRNITRNNKIKLDGDLSEFNAFYNALSAGIAGNVDFAIGEGADFTNRFELYLYNNPANISTNGKTLRDSQPEEWTTDHKLQGVTWAHVVLNQPDYGNDLDKRFWNNIPEIQVLIQGRYITWPNQLIDVFTDNAAALRYWYMTGRMGINTKYIDFPSVIRAFNKCEEMVDTVLTPDYQHFPNSHKRYTIDGLVSSGDAVETILFEMDQAWQGNVIYRDGMYYFEVGEEPTEFEVIDRDKIIDSIQVKPAPALQDRINSAGIVLAQGGPFSDWTEFHMPTIEDDEAIERDGHCLLYTSPSPRDS